MTKLARYWVNCWVNYRILAFAVLSCPLTVSAEAYRIGVLYWSENIPCQVYMSQGVESTAKQLSQKGIHQYELLTRVAGDGNDGIENQIRQMYELIDHSVDLIIVQPTDNAALSKPLIEANRKGIPVVAYDQYISQGELVSYVTSDNYQAGYYNGEYIADHFSTIDRPINLILVEYPMFHLR